MDEGRILASKFARTGVKRAMRKLLVTCMILALPECEASSQSDMHRQALRIYIGCLHTAARKLDDHRSEASIIAEAVAERCSGERNAAAAALSYAPQEISAATTIVLDERNKSPN